METSVLQARKAELQKQLEEAIINMRRYEGAILMLDELINKAQEVAQEEGKDNGRKRTSSSVRGK